MRQTIFCNFRPCFALLLHYWPQKLRILKKCKKLEIYPFTHVHPKSRSYEVMVAEISSTTDRTFCHFGLFFAILTALNSPKNEKNIKKFKNMPGGIIILHKYTKNHDFRLYCSWDMAHDRQLSTIWKIKISKKWKKYLVISSFYTSAPKIMIICYTVLEIQRVTDVIVVFHFGQFFALLPLTAKNMKISKK